MTSGRRVLPGALVLAALAGYTALVYYGLGPPPTELTPPWWQPRGFLIGSPLVAPLGENAALAIAALWLPALALAAVAFAAIRSAAARTLALTLALACGLFLFYGLRWPGPQIWSFFRWRGSAVMLGIALVTAGAAAAPLLAASWLRLRGAARAATYVPVLAGTALLESHVTGTDPSLAFAISPWPVVTVFGLDLVATRVAGVLACAALALAAWRWRPRRPSLTLVGVAAALAIAVAAVRLQPARLALLGGALGVAALALALASAAAGGLSRGVRSAPGIAAIAGVLLALPLVAGQVWTSLDYRATRDERAQRIIDALASFYEREGAYPEDLRELVAARDLAAIPSPRIGLRALSGQDFIYQNFGTDYLLEFSAPGWTQCAYSPPWRDAPEAELEQDEPLDELADAGLEVEPEAELPAEAVAADGEAEPAPADEEQVDEVESLPGSWSCPSKPPELW